MTHEHAAALHDVATYLAGQAVARVRLQIGQLEVTLEHREDALGAVSAEGIVERRVHVRSVVTAEDERHVSSDTDAADMVLADCAGHAALVAAGGDTTAASPRAVDDFEHAASLIACWGLDAYLAQRQQRAVAMMAEARNVAAVALVAEHVTRERTLDVDMIEVLVDLADGEITPAEFDDYLALRASLD